MPSFWRAARVAPVVRPFFCTTSPKTLMVPLPESIVCSPVIERRSVDLPDPEGPIRATISPAATSTDTPFRAFRVPKVLDTSRADTTLGPALGATAAAAGVMDTLEAVARARRIA